MNPRQEELDQLLLNKTITDIEFYSHNERYISPDHDKTWIITGGIELRLGDAVFSFGWHPESEFHDGSDKPVLEFQEEGEALSTLDAKNAESVKGLINKTILEIDYEWNSFQEYDENFELKETLSYMPVGMNIKLSDDHTLQIAAASYHLKDDQISKAIYNSEGNVLIAINTHYALSFEMD